MVGYMRIAFLFGRLVTWLYIAIGLPFAASNSFELAGKYHQVKELTYLGYEIFLPEMRAKFKDTTWPPVRDEFMGGLKMILYFIPHDYKTAVLYWNRLYKKPDCQSSVVLLNNLACCYFSLGNFGKSRQMIKAAYESVTKIEGRLGSEKNNTKSVIRNNYLYITENSR